LGISFAQTAEPAGDKKVAEPLRFLSSFSADQDVNGDRTNCQRLRDVIHPSAAAIGMAPERPAVCDQVVDIIAGDKDAAARIPKPILAAKVATDSKLRVLITEPSTRTVHILDFAHRKYLRIDGARGDRMNTPYGIAVDADNNIYITDLDRGRIVVYNASGKFMKYIGDVKGEGSFQNPRAIAIDRVSGRIYLADTSRNFVLILDRDGNVIAQFGKRGGGNGPAEFRQPTDLAIYGDELYILDRHNLRIQILDLDGNFRRQFNLRGIGDGDANGMAFDSQGRLFVLGMTWVQAFSRDGKPLFRFGHNGDQPGEFERPSDICTDAKDHVYVVDSGNRRIQVFQAR
jgi:DNA-binding beta-propeller fold protein YncE